jgi:hypothetical protein
VPVASLSVVLLGLLLLGLPIEGLLCLAMAAPIRLVLALAGGSMGYMILQRHWDLLQGRATFRDVLLFVPFFKRAEALKPQQEPLLQITMQMEINATEWPFRAGNAYPIRSTLR